MSQHHNQGSVVLRTITVLFALAAGFVGGCYVGFRQAPVDASSPGLLRDDTAVLNRLNATTRLLSDLAAERWALSKADGETWLLTVHGSHRVQKYSDGKVIVVALPTPQPGDADVIRDFATMFNHSTLDEVDRLADAGHYSEALHLCRAMQHFKTTSPVSVQALSRRIGYLEQLLQPGERQAAREALGGLHVDSENYTQISEMGSIKSTIVTDLLLLEIK